MLTKSQIVDIARQDMFYGRSTLVDEADRYAERQRIKNRQSRLWIGGKLRLTWEDVYPDSYLRRLAMFEASYYRSLDKELRNNQKP